MTKVLVIGHVWPEPASSAAGSRMLALLACFATRGWQLTFASAADKTVHMADLEALGIATANIALNCSSFDRFVATLQPDLVMFDRFMVEEQFAWRVEKTCPGAVRILDTEDLFTLRHARHQAVKQSGRIATAVSPELLTTETAKREIAAILRCDLSLVTSEFEMQVLMEIFKVDPALLIYTPFLLKPLDGPQMASLPGFEERRHFLSIGNFRHPPNWDGVLFLKQSLWPLIRRRLPAAEVHIYGAYPPKKATQLSDPRQGFVVKGWADDAHRVMAEARVNLAPLRFGAGLKGKLADAMACGTPSVTTTVGAEAMAGELPWPGAIADDPQGFADGAVDLYQDGIRWHQCQQAGFRVHNQRFDRHRHGAALVAAIASIRDNLEDHRRANFTGAMLRHHLLKSTMYLSQWIETKAAAEGNHHADPGAGD